MIRKLLALLPLVALAAATSAHSQSPSAAGRSILVEEAHVDAIDKVEVPATQTGMLMLIHVKEGQSIEKDAPLADIDNRTTLASQRVAKGEWEAANAQAESAAELEVAQKAEEVSKAELDSLNEVRQKSPGAVSVSEYRKYKFQYEKSIAQVKQAIIDREIARLTATAKQAQYEASEVELDLRKIRAPFKGQVVEVFKKNGEWAQSGEAILHLVGLDRVRVSGFVLAKSASPSEVIGKPVVITVYSAGEKKLTVKGMIGFASPVIEGVGATHQFRVWAEVENEKTIDPVTSQVSWKIQPGSMAQMTIDLTPAAPAKLTTPSKTEPGKANTLPSAAKGTPREALKPVTNSPANAKAEPSKSTPKSENFPELTSASPTSKER